MTGSAGSIHEEVNPVTPQPMGILFRHEPLPAIMQRFSTNLLLAAAPNPLSVTRKMAANLDFLPAVAGAVAAAIGTSLLLRSVRAHARTEGDAAVVEYGRPTKVFVIVAWLCFAGVAVAAARERTEPVLAWSVTAGFFISVLALHFEFFHVRIRYDGHGIHTSSPWRPSRVIPWDGFTEITFSRLAKWYVLHTRAHGRVRLHPYLSGLQSFLSEFQSRGFNLPKGIV